MIRNIRPGADPRPAGHCSSAMFAVANRRRPVLIGFDPVSARKPPMFRVSCRRSISRLMAALIVGRPLSAALRPGWSQEPEAGAAPPPAWQPS